MCLYIYIYINLEQIIRDVMETSGSSSQNFLVIRPTAVFSVLYRAKYILQICSQNLGTIISRSLTKCQQYCYRSRSTNFVHVQECNKKSVIASNI